MQRVTTLAPRFLRDEEASPDKASDPGAVAGDDRYLARPRFDASLAELRRKGRRELLNLIRFSLMSGQMAEKLVSYSFAMRMIMPS